MRKLESRYSNAWSEYRRGNSGQCVVSNGQGGSGPLPEYSWFRLSNNKTVLEAWRCFPLGHLVTDHLGRSLLLIFFE